MADDAEVIPFATRAGVAPKPTSLPGGAEPDGECVDPGKAFAVALGPRTAIACEFIRRDGSSFAVPYSYAPLLWWTPPGSLLVEYPGFFSVHLRGSHLAELHRRFKDRKVTWVCETGEVDAASDCCVTTLAIVRSFPSRGEANETESK